MHGCVRGCKGVQGNVRGYKGVQGDARGCKGEADPLSSGRLSSTVTTVHFFARPSYSRMEYLPRSLNSCVLKTVRSSPSCSDMHARAETATHGGKRTRRRRVSDAVRPAKLRQGGPLVGMAASH